MWRKAVLLNKIRELEHNIAEFNLEIESIGYLLQSINEDKEFEKLLKEYRDVADLPEKYYNNPGIEYSEKIIRLKFMKKEFELKLERLKTLNKEEYIDDTELYEEAPETIIVM